MDCGAVQFYCNCAISVDGELGIIICNLYEWSVGAIKVLNVDEVVQMMADVMFASAVWDGYFH